MPGIIVPPALPGPSLNADQTWTGNEAFNGRLAIGSGYPWVDVRSQGAVGDGVADDTAAFLAALAKVPAFGGILGIVFVPPGRYKITSQLAIPDYVTLMGCGYTYLAGAGSRGATCLIKSGNFDGVMLGNASQLRNLQVDGAAGNGGDGIYVNGGRATLDRVAATSHGGCGIRIGTKASGTNTNVWRLNNVFAIGNTSHGVYVHDITTGGAGGPNANAGLAVGVECHGNGGDGVNIEHAIDNNWLGVTCQSNTGWGIRLANGAVGPSHSQVFWFPYLELNTAGAGTIDASATLHVIWGSRYNPGVSDGWVNNDTSDSNLILGIDTGPIRRFRTPFGSNSEFIRGYQTIAYQASFSSTGFFPLPNVGEWIEMTLTGNVFVNDVGAGVEPAGLRMLFKWVQDATGGRSITYGSAYKGAAAISGQAANTVALDEFMYDGAHWRLLSRTTGQAL